MHTAMTSQSIYEPSCVCLRVFWVSALAPVKLRCLHWSLHFCYADADVTDDYLWAFCCTAETERQGTDHLDLAGLPQRSSNSDSTHTLSTTPDSKKKSKGIKKLFGKWVETSMDINNRNVHMDIWYYYGHVFHIVWISFLFFFFVRLKRSQSTTFNLDENLPEGEFKRGGVRATAGPRLGWSRDLQRVNKWVCAFSQNNAIPNVVSLFWISAV